MKKNKNDEKQKLNGKNNFNNSISQNMFKIQLVMQVQFQEVQLVLIQKEID